MNKPLFDISRDIVTLLSNDILFLDTNVVVAYLYEKDPRHLAVHDLLTFLIHRDKLLCVDVTVVHEVIHVLSRTFYAEDMLRLDAKKRNLSHKKQKELQAHHSRNFLNATKPRRHFTPEQNKTCKETLRMYNTKAMEKFFPFLTDYCVLVHSDLAQVELALDLCTGIPLHSADAMIAASALSHNFTDPVALITLDRDLCSLPDITIYFFDARHDPFTVSTSRDPLQPPVLS